MKSGATNTNNKSSSNTTTSSSPYRPQNNSSIQPPILCRKLSSESYTSEVTSSSNNCQDEMSSIKKHRQARLKHQKHKLRKSQQQQQQQLQNTYYYQKQQVQQEKQKEQQRRRSSNENIAGGVNHEQGGGAAGAAGAAACGGGMMRRMSYERTSSDTALLFAPSEGVLDVESLKQQQLALSNTAAAAAVQAEEDKETEKNNNVLKSPSSFDIYDEEKQNSAQQSNQNYATTATLTADSLSLHNESLNQLEMDHSDNNNTSIPTALQMTPENSNHVEMILHTKDEEDKFTPQQSPQSSAEQEAQPSSPPLPYNQNTGLLLSTPETLTLSQNFAMEHRIFLRAILQLLTERDQYAVGVDVNDPHTIKAGPLKKASHLMSRGGIWKIKYVEIRRGLFSYYENEVSDTTSGQLQRKSIPLRANSCTCRAVKVNKKNLGVASTGGNPKSSGYIFELTVETDVKWKRLWMASTREDRTSWIHAIHDAMIGGSVTRGDNFLDYQMEKAKKNNSSSNSNNHNGRVPSNSPYKQNLEEYLDVQEKVRAASCKEEYVDALSCLCGIPLNVPVQWIKEHVETMMAATSKTIPENKAFVEDSVAKGISQLWKDMLRDSVSINGELLVGDGGHGPEQIIGALTRSIISFDKSSPQNDGATKSFRKKFRITESAALSYARDILLACNRTRSGGDSYYCVDTLCSNPALVVLCPSSTVAEPLSITVQHALVDEGSTRRSSIVQKYSEISGWLMIKTKSQKHWKKRFGVLSEGVLSFYRHDKPRPHGLQGQLILSGATITAISDQFGDMGDCGKMQYHKSASQQKLLNEGNLHSSTTSTPEKKKKEVPNYALCITTAKAEKSKKKEQYVKFDAISTFALWNKALSHAVVPPEPRTASQNLCPIDMTTPSNKKQEVHSNDQPHEDDKDNEDVGDGDDKESTDMRENFKRQKNRRHFSRKYSERMKFKAGRARSTVEVLVKASAMYKICTTDPQGDEEEDTWVMLKTHFLQKFRLSGGPNGRIMRGEEVVQLNFLQGLVPDDAFNHVFD